MEAHVNTTMARVLFVVLVAVICGVLIGGAYVFVLPAFFPGYKTMWIGILGILLAMLTSGYIGYHIPRDRRLLIKISASFGFAALVAPLVIMLSWFIIANIRGE
jgi:hypothetical protein